MLEHGHSHRSVMPMLNEGGVNTYQRQVEFCQAVKGVLSWVRFKQRQLPSKGSVLRLGEQREVQV